VDRDGIADVGELFGVYHGLFIPFALV
jgi:hypothetical protein